MVIDTTGQTIKFIEDIPEIWKPIDIQDVAGFYEVSNYGRIKSKARYDLKGSLGKKNYLNGGKIIAKIKIHLIIMFVFVMGLGKRTLKFIP